MGSFDYNKQYVPKHMFKIFCLYKLHQTNMFNASDPKNYLKKKC